MKGKKDAHLPIVTSGPAGAEGGCVCVFGSCAQASSAVQAGKLSLSLAWDKDGTSAMREFGGHTGVR